jgi:hypothetical protein
LETYSPKEVLNLRNSDCKTRWRFGLLAAVAVTLVAFAPQLYFNLSRGSHWNGAYAQTHGDESVYASYLNSLIDGRPRRNNPYSGRDDSQEHPAAESYLSVQFLPPFLIATTARLVRISSTNAFMALTVTTAFVSALAVFWLLASILKDSRLAAIGVLVVLLASSANLIVEHLLGLGDSNNYLPFLRRYLPAAPFPILFIYCGLLLQMLTATSKRVAAASVVSAGILFAVLVFSYFYDWTFAVVWTGCLAGIWFVVRPHERKRVVSLFLILAGLMIASVVPYLLLISRLGATTGEAHFMATSHKPDLFRLTELFGRSDNRTNRFPDRSRLGEVQRTDGGLCPCLRSNSLPTLQPTDIDRQITPTVSLRSVHWRLHNNACGFCDCHSVVAQLDRNKTGSCSNLADPNCVWRSLVGQRRGDTNDPSPVNRKPNT